jgi:hypothetical protein
VRQLPSGKLVTYAVFNGRFRSFGLADDPTSRTRFAQAKAAWEANGRSMPEVDAKRATIEDLADAFLVHAEVWYRRFGSAHVLVRLFGALVGRVERDARVADLCAGRYPSTS